MTGLSGATILEWEAGHGVGKPVLGASGEMLYSRDGIEELLAFRRSHEDGLGPVSAAPEPRVAEREPPGAPGAPARLLVLLAERDPYAAELTEYFLRTEGYTVATVFSLEDARRQLAQSAPDLAIVELLLEGGAGFSLVQQINAEEHCPVIVLSTLNPGDHPAVTDAAAILPKPVKPLELVSTVRDLLGTSALVRGSEE